ncbi:DNA adenine methylase [Mycolicibacter minnesotensis]
MIVGAMSDQVSVPPPFLRWAGSKRWLIPKLQRLVPANFNCYYEPFLGSGAVYFKFAHGHRAHLSDVISPLIRTYRTVRDQPELVYTIATSWPTDKETYYSLRSQHVMETPAQAAARFIYLNRLCFNGLYRENSAGNFNVPYGRPRATNTVADLEHLDLCAQRLRNRVTLSVGDFEEALEGCNQGDFVYLDPPYVAGHRSNGFVDYNARIFSWDDQKRLAYVFRELDRRGVHVILSNADHESLRALYKGIKSFEVQRHSSMSGKAGHRGRSAELVIVSESVCAEVHG